MTENEAKIFIQNAMEQSKNVLAELMLIMPKVFAVRKKNLGEYYSNLENCKKEIQSCEVAIKALEEVQKYRKIEKDLKERYHANVDIPLLMHHFIETVFEGEKHEGFCLLTNEDREAWEEYKAIGTPEELQKAEKEENILKFYYCDSEDSYLIGRRVGNFYYAHYLDGSWVFDMSRYLPWGIYINGREYPSEPREINFSEWLKGFVKKECGGTPEECLRNKDFLDYLSDKMNPNDFETYLRLYNALEEKGNEE